MTYQASSDPSLVDSLTLLKSLSADIEWALANSLKVAPISNEARIIRDTLIETRVTLAELIRREERLRG